MWILPSAIYYSKDGTHKNNGIGEDKIPHILHFRMSIEYMFPVANYRSRFRSTIRAPKSGTTAKDACACKYDLRGEQMMKFCPSIHSAFQLCFDHDGKLDKHELLKKISQSSSIGKDNFDEEFWLLNMQCGRPSSAQTHRAQSITLDFA